MTVSRDTRVDAGLTLVALLLLLALQRMTGAIEVNSGRGWDGADYAAMLSDGLTEGTANTALRPLVVLLTRPAYWLLESEVTAFRVMNFLFAGLLSVATCRLFARYNPSIGARTLLVINLFLCIATAKYSAFYPVLIDMGALAIITTAIAATVSGHRVLAAVALVGAVTAREFGLAAVIFTLVHDVRQRAPWRAILGTTAPAIAALVLVRVFVNRSFDDTAPLSFARLVVNLQLWRDPVFAGLFIYFTVTVFGGISLFAAGAAPAVLRLWKREWEWVAYAGFIGAASAAGDADIWRYLVYLLPAAVAGAGAASRELSAWKARSLLAAALALAATLITQRPWERIDLVAYFRDWFPYYLHKGGAPIDHPPSLWPLWGWRFLIVVGLLWAMTLVASPLLSTPRSTGPSPDAR
jgi:hypothetical protein